MQHLEESQYGTCGLIASVHVPDVAKTKVIVNFFFFFFLLTYIKYILVIRLTLQTVENLEGTSRHQRIPKLFNWTPRKKVSVFGGQVKNVEIHHTGT